MSSNQQKKQSATSRLKEQRAREVQAEKRRRRIVIGVSSLAVLALVGGVAFAVSGGDSGSGGPADSAAAGPLVVPANASGPDGTLVTYGKADAPHTLKVYEDFRCPVCEQLEANAGTTMQQLADDGTYKIEYQLATFLDKNLGGKGSRTRSTRRVRR
jgi:protein-disulfide isomerase